MKKENQLQEAKPKSLMESVISQVTKLESGGLKLPTNYSAENAVRSAWLILQETQTMAKKPVLEACTNNSIASAVMKMVVSGLDPIKNQCYFIAYGNKLNLTPSYFGSILVAKRAGMKDVKAMVIREGDEFEYNIDSNGRMNLIKHHQPFENLNNKAIGAYAIMEQADGTTDMDVMTMEQIKKSWQQGATKGNSPAHKNFEDEMAKRTIIQRAIKTFVNSSDDSHLFDGEEGRTEIDAHVSHTIDSEANKTEIGFDDAEDIEVIEDVNPEPKVEEKEAVKGEEIKMDF